MTVIVAVKNKDHVLVGCDSQTTSWGCMKNKTTNSQ